MDKIVIKDIDVPFWSMVKFIMMWMIATVIAFLLLALIGITGSAIITLIFTT